MQQELPTNLPTIKTGTFQRVSSQPLEPHPDETTRQDSDSLSVGDRSHDQQVFLDAESDKPESIAPGVTKKIKKRPSLKKKYNNITNELRSELLDAVENKNEKIKHAAKRLNINYSSAKSICQVFKKEGRSEKKTFKKRDSSRDSHDAQPNEESSRLNLPHEHMNHLHNPEKIDPEKELVLEPPEQKDTLNELRLRLLNSRKIGHENVSSSGETFKKFLNYTQGQKEVPSNSQDIKQTEKQGRGNQSFHQSNHTSVVNIVGPGMPQQSSNSGMDGRTDGRMDGMMGKSYPSQNQSFVFVSPNQMGPMLISQPMMPGNYNVLIPQQDKQNNHPQTINIGPSQTINVNQPHNENHMMHGSYNDGHSNMQTSPTYQGQQMPQQVQYYQIHQPNMMMGPYQGVQLVQPVIYVTPQGNMQSFQQQSYQQQPQYVPTSQMPYMMGVPQNQISFQPVMINSYDQGQQMQGFEGQKAKLASMGQMDGAPYSMNNNGNNNSNNNNHGNHNHNHNLNHNQNHNQNSSQTQNNNQNHTNHNNQNHSFSQNQKYVQNYVQNTNQNHNHNQNQNQIQNHIQNQKQFEKKENGTSVGKDP